MIPVFYIEAGQGLEVLPAQQPVLLTILILPLQQQVLSGRGWTAVPSSAQRLLWQYVLEMFVLEILVTGKLCECTAPC